MLAMAEISMVHTTYNFLYDDRLYITTIESKSDFGLL